MVPIELLPRAQRFATRILHDGPRVHRRRQDHEASLSAGSDRDRSGGREEGPQDADGAAVLAEAQSYAGVSGRGRLTISSKRLAIAGRFSFLAARCILAAEH